MQSTDNGTISMGKPITAPVLIPVLHKATPECINEPFMVNGAFYRVTCVSFGSPHGAVLVEDIDNVDVAALGSALGTHVLFPKGASIVFLHVLDRDTLKARVWQHGEGEIAFSVEAACVAAVTAIKLQKTMKPDAHVRMGDYSFHVQWDSESDEVLVEQQAASAV